tara:strand:- start:25 stop:417 length:393 start_codon:yes stop_codon:yes gene_type:complete
MKSLEALLSKKILVLDGAVGTMLQAYNFDEADFRGTQFEDHHSPLVGNNDLLSITQPDAIYEVHAKYLEAGADIIETNTFSSTTIAMEDYALADYVMQPNVASAQIARKAADDYTKKTPEKPRFVPRSFW